MINDVERNAGHVYRLLEQNGRLSLRKIGEFTHRKESLIFLAIGWLLRESKINISEANGELFFELQ